MANAIEVYGPTAKFARDALANAWSIGKAWSTRRIPLEYGADVSGDDLALENFSAATVMLDWFETVTS